MKKNRGRSGNKAITLNFIFSTDGINIDLAVYINFIDALSATVYCIFFQPEYTCTIDYGTDSSYTKLLYRNTTFTQNKAATIILSQKLRRATTYYFIVSAEGSSRCVRVRGSFQTGTSVMKFEIGTLTWHVSTIVVKLQDQKWI